MGKAKQNRRYGRKYNTLKRLAFTCLETGSHVASKAISAPFRDTPVTLWSGNLRSYLKTQGTLPSPMKDVGGS